MRLTSGNTDEQEAVLQRADDAIGQGLCTAKIKALLDARSSVGRENQAEARLPGLIRRPSGDLPLDGPLLVPVVKCRRGVLKFDLRYARRRRPFTRIKPSTQSVGSSITRRWDRTAEFPYCQLDIGEEFV